MAAVAPFPGLGPSSLWRCTPAGIAPGRGRLLPGPSYFPRLGGRDCGRGRGRGRLARPPAGGPGRGRVGAELGRDPPARPCHACPARDLVKGSALFFLFFFFFLLSSGDLHLPVSSSGAPASAPPGAEPGALEVPAAGVMFSSHLPVPLNPFPSVRGGRASHSPFLSPQGLGPGLGLPFLTREGAGPCGAGKGPRDLPGRSERDV